MLRNFKKIEQNYRIFIDWRGAVTNCVCWHEWFFLVWTRGSEKRSVVTQCSANFFDLVWIISRYLPRQGKEMMRYYGCFSTTVATTCLLISCGQTDAVQDLFKDCTRELYDRVVRFEYLYYEGYWMYPYNKLRNHGPSYHYTEKNFCKFRGFAAVSAYALSLSKLMMFELNAWFTVVSYQNESFSSKWERPTFSLPPS